MHRPEIVGLLPRDQTIPGLGRSPGEEDGNPLQCSCLENPRDREPGGLLSMGSHRVGHAILFKENEKATI